MNANTIKAIQWLSQTCLGKWRMRVFEKKVRALCYSSIDYLPIYNWWRIKEGQWHYIYKHSESKGIPKGHKYVIAKIIKEMYDEYLMSFGFGAQLDKIISLEKECIQLRCEKVAQGKGINQTFVEIKEKQIAKIKSTLLNKTEAEDLFEISGTLEKIRKTTIDVHKCSVRQFYSYIKNNKKEYDSKKVI